MDKHDERLNKLLTDTESTAGEQPYYETIIVITLITNPIGLVSILPHIGMTSRARVLNMTKKMGPSSLKLVPLLSATNVKVICMLLPTVQIHLRLPSMTEFPLKHLITPFLLWSLL